MASLLLSRALDELIFLLGEVEDVDALRAGIGHDDPSARVRHHAVGTHQEMQIGRAHDEVENLGEESLLGLDVAIGAEAALEAELAAAIQQQFRNLDRRWLGARFTRRPARLRHQQQPQDDVFRQLQIGSACSG